MFLKIVTLAEGVSVGLFLAVLRELIYLNIKGNFKRESLNFIGG